MAQIAENSIKPVALGGLLEVDENRFNRSAVVIRPGLKVLHLTLAPGQAVPRHNHPGHQVVVQGLTGTVTVVLDDGAETLEAGALCCLPGSVYVSPRNDGDEPAAILITLAKTGD